jgi:hypothetical protein
MYELEKGRRPEKLADLVPAYLASVPDDPFAPDRRKLGYKPNANPPVLYSVNADGIDDGGAFALRSTGEIDWDVKDLPFFLNGDRPHRKPTTTTSRPTTAIAARTSM